MHVGRDRESPLRHHARNSNPAMPGVPAKPMGALPKRTSNRTVHTRARAERGEFHRVARPMSNSLHADGHVPRGEHGVHTPTPCVPLGA